MPKIHPREINHACRVGDLRILKRHLSVVSDINTPFDCSENRLLHLAASYGCLEAVKYLVENGADMNIPNKHGSLPMHIAIIGDKVKIVNFLIENGQDINSDLCQSGLPLHFALSLGKIEMVKLLLQNGANPDMKGFDNQVTALQLAEADAGIDGNGEIYEILKKAAIVNQQNCVTQRHKDRKSDNRTSKFENCVICEAVRNTELFALLPCLHANLCINCCKKILSETNPKCPTCRVRSTHYQKVFY